MSPRASLPGADELFRATSPRAPDDAAVGDRPEATAERDLATTAAERVVAAGAEPPHTASGRAPARRRGSADRHSTGRERHDEKITVYVSAGELVDLEHARLTLRAEHGIAVDRGRIVREALSVLLADLEAKHGESILVRRLSGAS